MPFKDLTFLLMAKDMSMSRGFEKVAGSADRMASGIKGSMGMAGIAVAGLAIAAGAESVRMAADFQTATMRLVTDAGESAKTIGKLSSGLLDISAQTGTSADDVAKGMYKVSSAGYTMAHGGLQVMKAAAEGAKVGGADLATVADALTTVMKDYGIEAGKSNNTTSELIATVSRGKTTMEDLAGSLHSVLPNAQALGIHLDDVLGALATMTQEGISADQATQNLNHTIVALANPTHVQAQEMAAMGLNATTVAAQLGKKGLTGTLNELVSAITSHMGKSGLILQKSFTESALAAQSANTMFKALPGPVRTVAQAYRDGSISQKTWTLAVKAMTPAQANLAKQWAATENASKGFSQQLRSGSGTAQTFTAALAKMTGGQTGLQVALHITGIHAQDTADNVAAIGKAAQGTQKNVSDWAKTQSTFNQQTAEFNATLDKLRITIGLKLLPALTQYTADWTDGLHQWDHIFAWFGGQVSLRINTIKKEFTGAGKWLSQAGKDVIKGLTLGIRVAVPDLQSTLDWVASLIPSGVKKFLNINSPSKVMIPIGSSVGEGLQVGLLGSSKQVQGASNTLARTVIGMFDARSISRSTENSALNTLQSGTNRLIAEATKRASLAKQITATQKSLTSELAKQKKLQDTTVVGSTVQSGDVTQSGSSGQMIENLQNLVAGTRRFKSDLQRLVKGGIDQDTFKQLVAAGVSGGGLAAADELLANPMDFKQVVALQRQLAAGANSLAAFAGQYEYAPTINATKAKLATLKGAQQVESWRSQKTAAGMLATAERELHLHLHLNGHYAGTKDDLAKTITTAIRDAVRRGQLPKNVLTSL